MDFGYLYTSFDGRISRQPFWLGLIALLVAIFAVVLIAAAVFDGIATPGTTSQAVFQLVIFLVTVYPFAALMIKRLHDRNRPAILLAVFYAPSILQLIGQFLGITTTTENIGGVDYVVPNSLGMIIGLIGLVIGIWALIELGILRGTKGPNQYGPDPLGGQ
jgi:uncharacterized membrane protein YhaH (DUF805 family)